MAIRDLIPWRGGRDVTTPAEHRDPFITLHREVNRLFEDAFRSFDLASFASADRFLGRSGWPNIEISENDSQVSVTAELPGLDEEDVEIELAHGALTIRGEKTTETEDKDRLFSERHYGRFERRIPVEDIDEEKVSASFRNGVLTVTLPKTAQAQREVKRIAISDR